MIREFEKYKYLGTATARKYYSHYFIKWEEDVLQTAYLGVYRALKDVDLTKIKNEVSLNAYITLKVRGEIMKWEKSLFGSIGSKRREVEYSMLSLDYSLHDSEADERITILDTLADTQAEDDMIRDIDLKKVSMPPSHGVSSTIMVFTPILADWIPAAVPLAPPPMTRTSTF